MVVSFFIQNQRFNGLVLKGQFNQKHSEQFLLNLQVENTVSEHS